MTQTIVITSGKGGVGKSNISANTAIELAQRNYRTCLFDADLGLANVNILLGIHPEYTLDDCIIGNKSLKEVVCKTKFGIDVIPGSSGIEKMATLDQEQITGLINDFAQLQGYDFCVIDTSSGISRGVIAFCLASTESILVITSEAASLTDSYALLKVMSLNNYRGTVKILVNKTSSIPQAKETYLRFKEVVNRHLRIDIAPAGIILNDPNIDAAVAQQEPALLLYPNSLAAQCIRAMVSNLLKSGENDRREEDFSDFWQRYFTFSHLISEESEQSGGQEQRPASSRPMNSAQDSSSQSTAPLPVKPAATLDQTAETKKWVEYRSKRDVSFSQIDGIFEVAALPSPVPLLSKALELLARGEMSWETLMTLFSSDPVLMVKALKMHCGQDPALRRVKRVTKKHQLFEELGKETLTNLLRSTCLQRALSNRLFSDTSSLTNSFWSHSHTCAILAEKIAEFADYPFPEEAYLAALIHDIGHLALRINRPELYEQISSNFQHGESLLETEQTIFGMNHAEIGARALRSWHLDGFMVDAVQYHTEPVARIETAFNLVKIVYLAIRLTQSDKGDNEIGKLGESLFGLSSGQLENMRQDAGEKTRQLADSFDIPLNKEQEDSKPGERQNRFRRQAMEYSILQGVLPPPSPGQALPEIIRAVFQAFNILFNIKAVICLMPAGNPSLLRAFGYPNCFGWETLTDIQFSLTWEKSLVVRSYMSGELKTALDDEIGGLALADRQLLHSLGTQGFACVPMMVHGINRGVIVFGIEKTLFGRIDSLKNRLEQFGVQAAKNISSLDKTV